MNDLVKLKFMRSILCYYFGNQKVVILDEMFYEKKRGLDKDCDSLMKLTDLIDEDKLPLSFESLFYIYNNIFPNLKKDEIDKCFVKKILNDMKLYQDSKQIIKTFLSNSFFGKYNYCILGFAINILHHKKTGVFYVLPFGMEVTLKENIKDDEKFDKTLKYIDFINENYHKEKPIFTIQEIENKVNSIPDKVMKFYGIEEIFLFGSYAKKRSNRYSDLDFHIIVGKYKNLLDEQSTFIENYFSMFFECKVDISVSFKDTKLNQNELALYDQEIKLR